MACSEESLTTALYETLDSVVAPAIRDAIITSALELSDRDRFPQQTEELRGFVLGPLRTALISAVGPELGDSITDELCRVLSPPPSSQRPGAFRGASSPSAGPSSYRSTPPGESSADADRLPRSSRSASYGGTLPSAEPMRASSRPPASGREEARGSGQRLARIRTTSAQESAESEPYRAQVSSPPSDSAQPVAPPASSLYPRGTAQALGVRGADSTRRLPFILVATVESHLVKQLAGWLDPRAAVIRVRSIMALLHDLENVEGAPAVIIVDCKSPSVRPTALAGLADELPPSVHVVLWGAPPELERQVVGISERARSWFVCAAHAEAKDVAERCAELVR